MSLPENADLIRYDDGIYAVDTAYVRPRFDASHLIVENGRAAFVDVGINSSVPLLHDALRHVEVDPANVDFLFVTHAHLDHAGGAGLLLESLPNATVVAHPRAAPHLIDPDKLIKGTIAVYGEARYREIYGDIRPLPEDRVVVTEDMQSFDLSGRHLECFYTEGHARHHYCLWDGVADAVFTGDSFGVSYRELDTDNGPFIFPTTTPIDFDPVQAHLAIERILAYDPGCVYLTHFSRVADLTRLAAAMHDGIDALVEIALEHADDADRTGKIAAALFAWFAERLAAHGFDGDEAAVKDVVGFDVELNTMGLEVWLERRNKALSG